MVNRDRLIKTFFDLVKIPGPPGKTGEVAVEVKRGLKNLGVSSGSDKIGNVFGCLKGAGEPFLLSFHLDVVEPCAGVIPALEDGRIFTKSETTLGYDDRGAIAAFLEALACAKEKKIKLRHLEFLFTVDEEIGCVGLRGFDSSKLKSRRGVNFDGKLLGEMTIAAPFITSVDIRILGRAAHAGSAPEKGISAVQIAARAIDRLKLGRIDEETTANIGIITGGDAVNAIPEKVFCRGEIRSRSKEKLNKLFEETKKIFKKAADEFGGAVETHRNDIVSGYRIDLSSSIIKEVRKAIKNVGLKPVEDITNGGSDVNYLRALGFDTVDLGIGVHEAHSTREWSTVEELAKLSELILKLMSS